MTSSTRTPDRSAGQALAGQAWGGPAALVLIILLAVGMTAVAVTWPAPPTDSEDRQPTQWQTRYVSDLPYTAIANGLGPVERDTTNGGDEPEDGEPIDVDGVRYERGLGVHPYSQVRIHRPAECERFVAVVAALAVDGEGDDGWVAFKVLGDGRPLYRSEPLAPADSTRQVDIDVTGVERIDLVAVTHDGGGATASGVWADARLECQA